MDRKEAVKDIQRLRRNIERRLSNISKPKNYGTSNRAVSSYGKIDRSSLRGKSVDELKAIRRDLLNFNQKQFSRVKGYEKYQNFENTFNELDEDVQDEVWTLYDKFVEEKRFLQKYKYDVLREISEGKMKNKSDRTIRKNVGKLYDELLTDNEMYEQQEWDKFRNETNWTPKRFRNK